MVAKFDYKCVTKDSEFRGAVKNYKTDNGVVAIGFTTTNAYIMEDSEGLYTLEDLKHNIKQLGMDTIACREAVGVATTEGGDEEVVARLGLSDEDVTDIIDTLKELCQLEVLGE